MSKSENMQKFVDFQEQIASGMKQSFYKSTMELVKDVVEKYWRGYSKILKEVYDVQCDLDRNYPFLRDYDIRPDIGLRFIIRDNCGNNPMERFIADLLDGMNLYRASDVYISGVWTSYDNKEKVFEITYNDFDSDSYEPPSYVIAISPEEVLKASEDGYIEKQVEAYYDRVHKDLDAYMAKINSVREKAKNDRNNADYELYRKLKQKFEPEI